MRRPPAAEARARLQALPGVGRWTWAEVAQRALGLPDEVSFGDYHVAKDIGWALTGTRRRRRGWPCSSSRTPVTGTACSASSSSSSQAAAPRPGWRPAGTCRSGGADDRALRVSDTSAVRLILNHHSALWCQYGDMTPTFWYRGWYVLGAAYLAS